MSEYQDQFSPRFASDQDADGVHTPRVGIAASAGELQESVIAAGGTAQSLFSGATPANGFEVVNTSATEILYFREAGTATVAGATSIPIQPLGSYTTPGNYKPTGFVSVIAATTGHPLVARRY